MNPFPWLLSLIMPACGAAGAYGLPVPPPMDMAAIARPASPNTALAAPAGFSPAPDIVTPPFSIPPARLYAAIRAVAASQPRTFLAANYDERLQAHYVVRSALLNFPDLVTVSVAGPVEGPSTLVVYGRSVYGRSDLGVNRKRIEAWMAALDSPTER
jgi:uncharacterized protein (DUF1499 family)